MQNYMVGENDLLFPKVDFLFARIFGSEEGTDLLRSLVSAVMKIPEESLRELKVTNPKLGKDYSDDRSGVLDIKAEVNGEQINIEMQLVPHKAMAERVMFYWAKVYTEPFQASMDFSKLKRTVSIIICDESFLPLKKYHSRFHLWEDDEKDYKFTDALEIHVLEIQKALNSVDNENDRISDPLLRWLWYLSNNDKEVCEMLSQQSEAMHKAVDLQERYSRNREARDQYTRWLIAEGDRNTRLSQSREEGLAAGISIGEQRGISVGKVQTAKKMIEMNLPLDVIQQATGLSSAEIENLFH